MGFEQFIFYLFAGLTLAAAIGVIAARNPVHSALWLVLTFFGSAALWILIEAEFLGITLVLVYVGAVMVLFLFVVMMLDINLAELRAGFARILPVGILVALVVVAELALVLGGSEFATTLPERAGDDYSNTQAIGHSLYTDYLYPFELAAIILLLAIIAAIVLTMRRRPQTKAQRPAEQIAVDPRQRVKLVSLRGDEE